MTAPDELKNTDEDTGNDQAAVQPSHSFFAVLVKIILPLMILSVAVIIAVVLIKNRPHIKRSAPRPSTALVAVVPLSRQDITVTINGQGIVMPARQVALKAQVSGRIIAMDPEFYPGCRVAKDQSLCRIEPNDYVLDVQQARANVLNAQAEMELEMGYQDVAQAEWNLLGIGDDATEQERTLALRVPQLKQKNAAVMIQQSQLARAELDLHRTEITAPFNAIVLEKHIDPGTVVSTQDTLGTLAGTDRYWVQVSIPTDRLSWIDWPDDEHASHTAAPAEVLYQRGTTTHRRSGHVLSLLGDLDPDGLMARILIEVNHPLDDTSSQPLLLGDYVTVQIQGRTLSDVFVIDRQWLHDNDTLWIADADNRLDIRPVQCLWKDERTVCIGTGLTDGERLITTNLPAPIAGMPLEIMNDSAIEDTTAEVTP